MDDKQEQKFHQLTETPVGPLICRLALPCILSMLVTSFYNMADTFFVGMQYYRRRRRRVFPHGHYSGGGVFLWPRQRQLYLPGAGKAKF